MLDFDKLRLAMKRCLRVKAFKASILILAGVFLFLGASECWLNFKVRRDLRQSLGWGSGPQVKINAHINWLSLKDILSGRVGWVRIDGENCLISNLRFTELHLDNKGFTFNLPRLFRERRLELIRLNQTRIHTRVAAAAFSDYLNIRYPEFKPAVTINPGELVLSGRIELFGNPVPAELAGAIKIVPPKDLRFFPTKLAISGRKVPSRYLSYIGNQLPMQFTVMADWPLAVTAISLNSGYAALDFQELNHHRLKPVSSLAD